MDYKKEIISILEKIENPRYLRCIYGFVKGMRDDRGTYTPDRVNSRKDS